MLPPQPCLSGAGPPKRERGAMKVRFVRIGYDHTPNCGKRALSAGVELNAEGTISARY